MSKHILSVVALCAGALVIATPAYAQPTTMREQCAIVFAANPGYGESSDSSGGLGIIGDPTEDERFATGGRDFEDEDDATADNRAVARESGVTLTDCLDAGFRP